MQYWIDSLALQNPSSTYLWRFLPFGFLLTVLVESPFLWFLLPKLNFGQRLWNGIWLTACTYPIVVLVLPSLLVGCSRGFYLLIAETFAPIAECCVFWLAMNGAYEFSRRDWTISFATIIAANLASFAVGEFLWVSGAY